MFAKRSHQSVPLLNMTSTADISFMLLIFFLVTTSMDAGKGITRVLPPQEDSEKHVVTDVERSHLMTLEITAEGQYLVDGELVEKKDLQPMLAAFIRSQGREHLFSLTSSQEASYESYFNLQNELSEAYRLVRAEQARELFQCDLEHCLPEQQQQLLDAYPHRVAETYQVEGKKGGEE